MQTVKKQGEGRAKEREGGGKGEADSFSTFLKCHINCFQPVSQANAPLSSVNEGKYVNEAALRKKWLIPLAADNGLNSIFCRQYVVSRAQGGEKKSLHPLRSSLG